MLQEKEFQDVEKKNEKRRPRGEKQEFHGRAVTFTVYEANG